MSDIVIKVENLSKQYRLGELGTGTISHDLNRWWHKVRGKEDPYLKIGEANDRSTKGASDYVWALRDINFEVKQGEVLGIIGKNGAGKSTLLKLLSRVTSPTTGSIKAKGRIASLLEVGTGFHEELTGRENIFLNGAILGMTKAEIRAKFDEIVAFSGTERYIDTPVKRYSSGMRVRLAFAVAAHLEPEILIVDEVLAVGDAEFQKKAIGKLKDVSYVGGRTVLFVSHDMQAISTLTDNCILLNNGTIHQISDTQNVIASYLNLNINKSNIYSDENLKNKPTISRVELITTLDNNIQYNGEAFKIKLEITIPYALTDSCISIHVLDQKERTFLNLWKYRINHPLSSGPGKYTLICTVPHLKLYKGNYLLNIYFAQPPGGKIYQIIKSICPFEVVMHGQYREYPWLTEECAYLENNVHWDINI